METVGYPIAAAKRPETAANSSWNPDDARHTPGKPVGFQGVY
jgi:hypothetical protein